MSEDILKVLDEQGLRVLLQKLNEYIALHKDAKSGGTVLNGTNQVLNKDEVALGRYNKTTNETIFSIGNGESEDSRKSSLRIDDNDDVWIIIDGEEVCLQKYFKERTSVSNINEITIDENQSDSDPYAIKSTDTLATIIKKLEKRTESGVEEVVEEEYFPPFGKPGIIYKKLSTGQEFKYDTKKKKYIELTPTIIGGLGSSISHK